MICLRRFSHETDACVVVSLGTLYSLRLALRIASHLSSFRFVCPTLSLRCVFALASMKELPKCCPERVKTQVRQ